MEILKNENLVSFDSVDAFIPFLKKCEDLPIYDTILFPFNNKGKKILYLKMSLAIWPIALNDKSDKRLEELSALTTDI